MSKQILILPGDGIGPEIMTEAVKVLELANEKYQLGFELTHDVIGALPSTSTAFRWPTKLWSAPARPTLFCSAPWAARSGTPSNATSVLSAAC